VENVQKLQNDFDQNCTEENILENSAADQAEHPSGGQEWGGIFDFRFSIDD
jgi:hypothetical protein